MIRKSVQRFSLATNAGRACAETMRKQLTARAKQRRPGSLPAVCGSIRLRYQRGGTVPGGGGGSEAVLPLSSGVMRRMVTRRLMRLGPSVCSFRYCEP